MLRATILMSAACLSLTACAGSNGAGEGLNAPDLEAQARQECLHPSEYLGAGDWEIIAGRIGDELIECEQRRDLAVQAFDGQRNAIAARRASGPATAK